jgi:hypothetical protein
MTTTTTMGMTTTGTTIAPMPTTTGTMGTPAKWWTNGNRTYFDEEDAHRQRALFS